MSPKYDMGTGVAWPDTLELDDRDDLAHPNDGLLATSFPMHVSIGVAEAGTVCSVDLDRDAATRLRDWLTSALGFISSAMDAVPDPGYVTPDMCQECGGHGCDRCRPDPVDHAKSRPR